ncbi:MAG TPA: acyltransferase family protein [Pseudomonadales bacterium]
MSHLHYRPDIDGLRAIAVLSVMIFHADSRWLPGGFVGVDIFFVISGFLITSIIQRQMQQQRFRFADFYLRRIRRILPLLFTVIAATLVAGLILLLPNDLENLGKSVRYAVLFFSNHYFAGEQDYFAPAAEQLPLLHTWSLAVEEQFYLVWPVMLLALLRHGRRWLLPAMLVLLVASLTLATLQAGKPALAGQAYYLLPARFGELLIGALLACWQPRWRWLSPALAAAAGAALLVASLVLLDRQSLFPGIHALWPCLGAALLIHAGGLSGSNPVSRLLAWRPLVLLGLLSYSLYLWHWPVLALLRYHALDEQLPLATIVMALALTFTLSYASWRWVENPARHSRLGNKAVVYGYFVLPALALLLASAAIKHSDGYLWRQDQRQFYSINSDSLVCHNRLQARCVIGDRQQQPAVLFVGDSHAAHLTTYLDHYASQQALAITAASADACPVFSNDDFATIGHSKRRQYCRRLFAYVSGQLASHDTLVLALRWEMYLPQHSDNNSFTVSLQQQLQQLGADGKQVLLVSQMPGFEHNVARLHLAGRQQLNHHSSAFQIANRQLRQIADRFDHVHYVDLAAAAMTWQHGMVQGKPAWSDDNHLNVYGQLQLLQAEPSWLPAQR